MKYWEKLYLFEQESEFTPEHIKKTGDIELYKHHKALQTKGHLCTSYCVMLATLF
jgi:hypothetical protein